MNSKTILAALKKHKSQRAAAKALGIPRTTFQEHLKKAQSVQFTEKKIAKPIVVKHKALPVQRFILTSAQDRTKVHMPFLNNLIAYAKHLDAQLLISGYTYSHALFTEYHDKNTSWYVDEVQPYLTNDHYEIGTHISFCGEMNIRPSATTPLSGLESYTRERWGIFPHAKVQLKSLSTMKDSIAKIIMTTGTVTKPNYLRMKDGLKAQFHHVYGAVLVEITEDGAFFCRHLLGNKKDGSFYDLNKLVKDETVTEGHSALAITWGDIHIEKIDPEVASASFFANDSLLNVLKPSYQFIHDLIDFKARNHHNIKDPHHMFEMWWNGEEVISDTIYEAADFLVGIERKGCQTVVVESNHDLALNKWLKTADYRDDPANAVFFLKSQLEVYQRIAEGSKDFSLLECAIKASHKEVNATFLKQDDSFVIAKANGGIECGMHGHLGMNGAKGSSRSFSKMGPKANMGHTHSAEIFDGIYTAGVTGSLDMGYNKGPSSWTHTHIVTYPNGKRALLTYNKGKFYA